MINEKRNLIDEQKIFNDGSLRNTVLTDLFKDQKNTVNFVEGKKRSTIVFTRDKTTAEELIPPAPEADRR